MSADKAGQGAKPIDRANAKAKASDLPKEDWKYEATGPLSKGILTDITKCIGCERCVEACAKQYKQPADVPAPFKSDDGLSGARFCSIVTVPGEEGENSWRAVRRQCLHCVEPNCAAACLVGAFTKNAEGNVEYDAHKCIGCRYCMLACPFQIPRYQYDALLPYVAKCKMGETCSVEGGMPACVSACPTEATIYGPRDKLIEEAHRRIASEPEKYLDHVWGEKELGGTHVMYVSDVPLWEPLKMPTVEELRRRRLPGLATESVPHLVHGWVLFTPVQFVTVGTALAGYWFVKRRQKLMAEDAAHAAHQAAAARSPEGGQEPDGGQGGRS